LKRRLSEWLFWNRFSDNVVWIFRWSAIALFRKPRSCRFKK